MSVTTNTVFEVPCASQQALLYTDNQYATGYIYNIDCISGQYFCTASRQKSTQYIFHESDYRVFKVPCRCQHPLL